MDSLVSSRTSAKGFLTRLGRWVADNKDIESDITAFKTREARLTVTFNKYSEVQDQIEELDIDHVDTEDRAIVEDNYFKTLTEIKNCIEFLSPLSTITAPHSKESTSFQRVY